MLSKVAKAFFSINTTTLIFGKKAREGIANGVISLNKATSSTLGPKVKLRGS